jgi:hypothetical protein
MAYLLHLSGFDSCLFTLESTQDPRDPAEVQAVEVVVKQQLAERFPEESKSNEHFVIDWADKRIEGSINHGNRLRRSAVASRALPKFIELIDLVTGEAKKAHAVATTRRGPAKPSITKPAGEWTRINPALELDSDDPIYQALRDI